MEGAQWLKTQDSLENEIIQFYMQYKRIRKVPLKMWNFILLGREAFIIEMLLKRTN